MLDHRLQVHLQGATAVVGRYRGNGGGQSDGIYSADPGVGRYHLISISSYHSMTIPTLCFPTFGLTCFVRDFMDPCNCMDPQCRVVSYLLTRFLRSSNHHRSFSWIPFRCRRTCGGVLMLGSLPSSSIVSPQRPSSGASLSSRFRVVLQFYLTTICGQIDRMYIFRET